MKADNDDSKRNVGLLDDNISIKVCGDIHKTAGQAMCWGNNYYGQDIELLVTVRQSKREIDGDEAESTVIGLVHQLSFCNANAAAYNQDCSVALYNQRAV